MKMTVILLVDKPPHKAGAEVSYPVDLAKQMIVTGEARETDPPPDPTRPVANADAEDADDKLPAVKPLSAPAKQGAKSPPVPPKSTPPGPTTHEPEVKHEDKGKAKGDDPKPMGGMKPPPPAK